MSPERAAADFLERIHGSGPLLVAVSGGSDSTALLMALHRAVLGLGNGRFVVHAATVDHGLRPASRAEAEGVAALCRTEGIPHRILTWHGPKPANGLQAVARSARYRLLKQHAMEIGALAVATGHTGDDQAETILMRSARAIGGAQDDGLAGMAEAVLYDRRLWVLRPFLGLGRDGLRAFLRSNGLGWIEDPSNDDGRFERVRMRKSLAAGGLSRSDREGAAARRSARARAAASFLAAHGSSLGNLAFTIDRSALAREDGGIDALTALVTLAGGRTFRPGTEQRRALAAFMAEPASTRVSLGRCVVTKSVSQVIVCRETRGLELMTLAPGEEGIWDGRFRIVNLGRDRRLCVGGAFPVDEEAGDLPAAIAALPAGERRRAWVGAPHMSIVSEDGRPLGVARPGSFRIEPVIARYDTFLPAFDWTLAQALARLIGRAPFSAPPLA